MIRSRAVLEVARLEKVVFLPRTFSTTMRRSSEGDTGALRAGGIKSGYDVLLSKVRNLSLITAVISSRHTSK